MADDRDVLQDAEVLYTINFDLSWLFEQTYSLFNYILREVKLVEKMILFAVWYIIYISVTIEIKTRVQEWNIYQLGRQPINEASQLEEYKYYALKVVFLAQ